jgi:hypothetical protein
MQAENQKLRKEINERTAKLAKMEENLELTSKECNMLTTITSMYSDMLGINIEQINGRDKEFLISIQEKKEPFQKVFEAKIESISTIPDRMEWKVSLNKLPLNPYVGYKIGQQLIFQQSNIHNFFKLVHEASLMA